MLSHFSFVNSVAHQASLSLGFSKQEYWSGLPCPPPGNLPDPGMEPVSLRSPMLAGGFFTTNATWEALSDVLKHKVIPVQGGITCEFTIPRW